MQWLCKCGKSATKAEFLWHWRNAADIGQKKGRYVCYGLQFGCAECISGKHEEEPGAEYQLFDITLNAQTKSALVAQVLRQVLAGSPWGYIPKTDIQKALRNVHSREMVASAR